MRTQVHAVLLVSGFSLLGAAMAASPGSAVQAGIGAQVAAQAAVRPWSASGGVVDLRWNHDLARDLGIRITTQGGPQSQRDGSDRFILQQTGRLQFRVDGGYLRGFNGGALQARGGYQLALPGGTISLQDFRLAPRAADRTGPRLDLIGPDGTPWFHVDHVMHELVDQDSMLAIRSSDVRISAQLARRLGQPAVAGWAIAELQLATPIKAKGSGAMALADQIVWHGDPAPDGINTYQNDLFMEGISAQYTRCDGCTGENGSGRVVVTPSSTLKNNVNDGSIAATIPGDPLGTSDVLWTAGIPWYSKFSGDFPPYGNDQHPYLIWNMYRVNADGSLEQIGRSGVKQAFLTTNGGCLDSGDHNSHVLGRGCMDTYATGNNDSNNSLSPRSEILPDTGQWGRCGSIFDTNCDGVANSSPAPDDYFLRLIVEESQIAPSHNVGASWLFESWYLAREDMDIYNSMATLEVVPDWTGNVWDFDYSRFALGTAIDRWIEQAALNGAPQDKYISEIAADGGHAKVGVKVTDLGNNKWRYDYAVMNLDFAFAQTEGAEPNLRILSTQGFDGFAVAVRATKMKAVLGHQFRDGDMDNANNWQFNRGPGVAKWSVGAVADTSLGWGMLYSFSLVSSTPPVMGEATLYADSAPVPHTYHTQTLVPAP